MNKHDMGVHKRKDFKLALFRRLDHSGYEDQEGLMAATTMDQICYICCRHKGEILVADTSGPSGAVRSDGNAGDYGEADTEDPGEHYERDKGIDDRGSHGVGSGESEKERSVEGMRVERGMRIERGMGQSRFRGGQLKIF